MLWVASEFTERCRQLLRQSIISSTPTHMQLHRVSIQFSSVQFSSVQFSSVQFSSVQFSSVQFSSVQFSSVQFSSVQFSSVQFSLFPAQINISYNNGNVHIMCRKTGGQKTQVLMNICPVCRYYCYYYLFKPPLPKNEIRYNLQIQRHIKREHTSPNT